jgi:hypothetical protein
VNLEDYNDVAARLAEFRRKHPEGSLQPVDPAQPFRVLAVADRTFVVYAAAAYRSPDDPRPGVGVAWEPWPGRTPYTKDSELQNAETSAWGRAIVAALAADTKRGIASREEVQARTEPGPPTADQPEAATTTPGSPSGPGSGSARELLAELHLDAGKAVRLLKQQSSAFASLTIAGLLALTGQDLERAAAYLRAAPERPGAA